MFVQITQTILMAIIVLTLFGSVYFSFKYRSQTDHKLRGLFAAKMNMSMGIMMIAISFIQMLLFSGSTVRVVIGAVFLLIGLFNLFAGIRNHGFFSRMKSNS
jgi:heme/copper-type cytochrome/quinol oxidase subunit 2